MALSKRNVRRYADTQLSIKADNGLLSATQIDYIISTMVKIIDHRRTLIIHIYSRGMACEGQLLPLYTIFQTKDEYITLERMDDENTRWRTAHIENLRLEGYCYVSFDRRGAFLTPQDMEQVTKFAGLDGFEGLKAVARLQRKIMEARLRRKIVARERATIELMETVPVLPSGFMRWVNREIVPRYVFYEYKRGKKPMMAFCSGCKKVVEVSGVKHNIHGKCPRCKRPVTFKAAGKAGIIVERVTAQVLQKTSDGNMVVRIFKIFSKFTAPDDHYLSINEGLRIFARWDATGKIRTEMPFYDSYRGITTNWMRGEPPRFSYWQESFACDRCGYLYTGNLPELLGDTVWRYCPVAEFARISGEPLELLPFLQGFSRYPVTEYLIKFGLTNLASSLIYQKAKDKVMNPDGRKIRDVLHVEPQDMGLLCAVNASCDQLELVQKLRSAGKPCDERVLRWFAESECSSAAQVVEFTRYMTMERLMRYVDEQYAQLKSTVVDWNYRRFRSKSHVVSEYWDYLRMCERMEYNMSSKFVLFPKNLMQAHDRTSQVYEDKKTQIYAKAIEAMYRSLRDRYTFVKGKMAVIPPRNVDEIIREGHALRHCVGSYVDRVADNHCTILFLRKLDAISTPFYTIEIRDGGVNQVRGQKNCEPTREVKRFIHAWEAKKLAPALPAAA